jgi:hypothetical protein
VRSVHHPEVPDEPRFAFEVGARILLQPRSQLAVDDRDREGSEESDDDEGAEEEPLGQSHQTVRPSS